MDDLICKKVILCLLNCVPKFADEIADVIGESSATVKGKSKRHFKIDDGNVSGYNRSRFLLVGIAADIDQSVNLLIFNLPIPFYPQQPCKN